MIRSLQAHFQMLNANLSAPEVLDTPILGIYKFSGGPCSKRLGSYPKSRIFFYFKYSDKCINCRLSLLHSKSNSHSLLNGICNMFQSLAKSTPSPKCFFTHGTLPTSVNPERPPGSKKPYSAIAAHYWCHTVRHDKKLMFPIG